MRLRRENVLVVAGIVAAALTVWIRDGSYPNAEEVLYYGCYAPLCGLAWWAALRLRSAGGRSPWVMLAAFETAWLIGDLFGTVRDRAFEGRDDALVEALSWSAQGCYWIGYAAIFAMLVIMVRRRAPGQLRAGVLDGLTMATALGIAVWHFLVLPQLQAPDFDIRSFGFAMYPLADVVVIAAVLLLALAPGRRGVPTRMLVGSAFLITANDLGYNLVDRFAPELMQRMPAVALLSNVLMVAVSLHRGRAELTTPVREARRLHPARVVFLGVALLTAPAMSFMYSGTEWRGERILLLAGTIVTSALILARFTTAVRAQEHIRRELAYQASHDSLTGLVNRRTLTDQLHHALTTGDCHAVLLYVDLDGFKAVNDGAGHAAGDAVLVEVGRRLNASVRKTDIVARLGGDEFAVLCPGDVGLDSAADLARRILEDLTVPVLHAGEQHHVGASIGIAVPTALDVAGVGADARAENLLRSADHAMFEAKRLGKGRWVVAQDSVDQPDLAAAA